MSIYTARVLNAWAPSLTTRAIRVEKPPEVSFVASQATRLILGDDLARPMTIASGPTRPYLDFAVQRTESEFKRPSLLSLAGLPYGSPLLAAISSSNARSLW
jgi:hypothetical protein